MWFQEGENRNTNYFMSPYEPRVVSHIYDQTGINTLYGLYDYQYSLHIDLRPGYWSRFGVGQYIQIGPNAQVTNAVGGEGSDTLIGNWLNNALVGRGGNDTIYGLWGNDAIWGGAGSDQLFGGLGSDTLSAGYGNDTLWGEDGNDLLYDGTGSDVLVGGAGSDRFVFSTDVSTRDLILGFDGAGRAGGDVIDLRPLRYSPDTSNLVFVHGSAQDSPWSVSIYDWGEYTVLDVRSELNTYIDHRIFIDDGAVRANWYIQGDDIVL